MGMGMVCGERVLRATGYADWEVFGGHELWDDGGGSARLLCGREKQGFGLRRCLKYWWMFRSSCDDLIVRLLEWGCSGKDVMIDQSGDGRNRITCMLVEFLPVDGLEDLIGMFWILTCFLLMNIRFQLVNRYTT